MAGCCLGLGLQLRIVESFVMRLEVSQFLKRWLRTVEGKTPGMLHRLFPDGAPVRQTITPPEFVSWALLATGIVLLAHIYSRRSSSHAAPSRARGSKTTQHHDKRTSQK